MKILETNRLILRTFDKSDLNAMAAINSDPKVCEFLPTLGTRASTEAVINRILQHQHDRGFSLYAVELKSTQEMIGWIGLMTPSFEAHFTPAIEIGWRIASAHWQQGYATEGAMAVLHFAFNELKLDEVVSFTAVNNRASRCVMEKIGLHHNPKDDFDHPKLLAHRLARHVLYRLTRTEYLDNQALSSATVQQVTDDTALQICHSIRNQVFVEGQNVPIHEEVDELDACSEHYLLFLKQIPVGTARIRYLEDFAKIERVAILEAYQGRKLGHVLMKYILANIQHNHRVKKAKLSAQTYAIPFYEKLGFVICSDEYLDAGILHKDMQLSFKKQPNG